MEGAEPLFAGQRDKETWELWNLGTLELWNFGTFELGNLRTWELGNFGNLGTCKLGNLGTQELGNSGTWELGNLGTWELGNLWTCELGNLGFLELWNLGTYGSLKKNWIFDRGHTYPRPPPIFDRLMLFFFRGGLFFCWQGCWVRHKTDVVKI